jgi:dTDP-4-dehydrorhamnose reductase
MKILVTGANGQVGSELIRRGKQQNLTMLPAPHAELDISMAPAVETALDTYSPNIVINAAAYTAVDKAESKQERAYAINGKGAEYLARSCAKRNVPLLHISTDYIFDGNKDEPYTEEDIPNPTGIYGASKLAGEQAVTQNNTEHIILRVAWVFGACGNNFARTMLRLAKEHKELRIVADQHGGPTWAGDIADTLLDIATQYDAGKTIPWGTYHYSGAPTVNWSEFAEAIFSTAIDLGLLTTSPKIIPITTKEYPTPAKRPQNSALNCTKIKQHFKINQPDWQIGLKETLEEWQTA